MFIAAVRSAATYLAVSLYVLITAPIGMLLAILFRWKSLLYVFGHGGVRLGLATSGIRYRVAGAEHLPFGRAAVYCANHQSNVDPPLLFTALHPRMHILYKHEIDRIPLLARAFRMGGFGRAESEIADQRHAASQGCADCLRAIRHELQGPARKRFRRGPAAEL